MYFYQLNKSSSVLTNSFLVCIAFLESVPTFMEMGFVYNTYRHAKLTQQPFCSRMFTMHQLRWRGREQCFYQLNQGMIRWQVERARVGNLINTLGNSVLFANSVMGSLMNTVSTSVQWFIRKKE